MKKTDYEKAITEAKDKGELIGVIIAFSQDSTLPGQRSVCTTIKRTCEC